MKNHDNTDGSPTTGLNERLSDYSRQSRARRPDLSAAYDALVHRLEALDRGEIGPQVGATMPDFTLPDETGRLTSLRDLVRSGPVVISFNRGHWCPYCRIELRSLAACHDRIAALGASVVSIMPDMAPFTADYAGANELPFRVLTDMDLGYALSLGLIFWAGTDVQRLYRDVGFELERYHGNDGYFLPMAAKFVVGRDGLVKARRVNLEFRERVEPDELIAILERLNGRTG